MNCYFENIPLFDVPEVLEEPEHNDIDGFALDSLAELDDFSEMVAESERLQFGLYFNDDIAD